MREQTIYLMTKENAELFCRRMYPETKIVPVTLCEDGKCNTYYSVYFKLANGRWSPLLPEMEPDYVKTLTINLLTKKEAELYYKRI